MSWRLDMNNEGEKKDIGNFISFFFLIKNTKFN